MALRFVLFVSCFNTMKTIVFFVLAVVAVAVAAPGDPKYTTKFDNVDLDEILKSDRLLKNYFNCLLDKGKCTPDGAELKKVLPDALKTACSKCSEKQKQGADKVLRFLIDKKKDQYDELEKKYDPQGTYRKNYAEEAKKRGIKI